MAGPGETRADILRALGTLSALLLELPTARIESIGNIVVTAYGESRTVFAVGNGGSAATASHLASDLGKNVLPAGRARLRVTSLTDNVPTITAIANDHGYENIFEEQVRTFGEAGDVLVAISASGASPNVLRAMQAARELGMVVVGLLGFDGGLALALADEYILVPSYDYGAVEDVHVVVCHAVTRYVRERLLSHVVTARGTGLLREAADGL
jgi:D-sedoheptulose 7-phosphate isomerase